MERDLVPMLAGLPFTPVELCTAAQALVILPGLATELGVVASRPARRTLPAASGILRALTALE